MKYAQTRNFVRCFVVIISSIPGCLFNFIDSG